LEEFTMKDMFNLSGKIAVVLGGAGGIGEGCASALAARGATVVIASRTQAKLDDAAMRIEAAAGAAVTPFTVDVTSETSIAALKDKVVEKFGTVDILVNAHGINLKVAAVDIATEGWDNLFATNVRGTAIACKVFGKIMVDKKAGKIINLSSIRGIRGTDGGNTVYGATKGAVDMITRMLAAEWAPYKVNVNALAPSVIMTEMIQKNVAPERLQMLLSKVPLKRFASVEDVAAACVYLAAPESDFVTGQIMYIDGGITAVG
jgi:NAD(P)-dependent dehydrogenase (short-subunit alcohol dehydrogenase family)